VNADMQLTFVVAILAAFLPLAAATYTQKNQQTSCKSSEFWCVSGFAFTLSY